MQNANNKDSHLHYVFECVKFAPQEGQHAVGVVQRVAFTNGSLYQQSKTPAYVESRQSYHLGESQTCLMRNIV